MLPLEAQVKQNGSTAIGLNHFTIQGDKEMLQLPTPPSSDFTETPVFVSKVINYIKGKELILLISYNIDNTHHRR